jgi:biotin carboxyl carrier protein
MVTRKIVVNGREISVSLGPDGAFVADGHAGTASVVEVEPDVYSVLLEGRSYEVRVQGAGLVVQGQFHAVQVEDPRETKRTGGAHAEGRQTLVAAMPGKVVRVLAREGDTVEAGQGIVVVEAMKMQNEVKSPKPGRIVTMAVAEGTAVSAGATLAVVE